MSSSGRDARGALVSAAVLFAFAIALGAASAGVGSTGLRLHSLTLTEAPTARASTTRAAAWCGTLAEQDRTPNALAGFPVHWMYAIPADGSDRSADIAGTMQSDAEHIDEWWRREDPTRTLRNDLAQFPCGAQLDISLLRLPQPGAQLAGAGRFGAIFNGMVAAGFRSERTKYVVYYDGPVSDQRVCGQGGSDRSGVGLAVLYVQACAGVSTAAVVAHEVLHTFGAVPSAAPNHCPAPNEGHVCDDQRDLMYPSIGLEPLSEKLLDAGRDDYYGHTESWLDTQDVPWLVQLDRQAPLAVTISGPGGVTADLPGLACAQSCTTTWNSGTRVTLVATPRSGAKLVRWSGPCTGSGNTCALTVGEVGAVTALFAPQTYRVAVRVTGQGSVRSARAGIACRPRCAAPFASHVPLRLTATPARGWKFRSWAGACRGTRPTCSVPMTRAATARAIFRRA